MLQVLRQPVEGPSVVSMDQLRQGIGLRAYAQKNPKQEYKRESFALFEDLLDNIKYETIRYLSHIEVATEADMDRLGASSVAKSKSRNREYQHAQVTGMVLRIPAEGSVKQATRNSRFIRRGPQGRAQRPLPLWFKQKIQAMSWKDISNGHRQR